jgi:transposase-like protein
MRRKRSEELLFYDSIGPVNIKDLSRATGIPSSTLYYWRDHVKAIPLEGAVIIAKARNLSREEWGSLI